MIFNYPAFQRFRCWATGGHEWVLSSRHQPDGSIKSHCACKKCGEVTEQFGAFTIPKQDSLREKYPDIFDREKPK